MLTKARPQVKSRGRIALTPTAGAPENTAFMQRFYLALGANLGDRRSALETALEALAAAGIPLDRVSSVHDTAPVGGPEGSPRFLNQVASGPVDSGTPPPRRLLERLLEVEARLGRTRRERNAPRLMDIDLLLYGERVVDEPGLRVPHPRLQERRFVLEPLCELAPELVHPVLGLSMAELLEALPAEEGRPRSLGARAAAPPSSCEPGGAVL
jgi:2-amino-4-hydroxy-6-hydroxymethyldihydropteridine diphosphokinase